MLPFSFSVLLRCSPRPSCAVDATDYDLVEGLIATHLDGALSRLAGDPRIASAVFVTYDPFATLPDATVPGVLVVQYDAEAMLTPLPVAPTNKEMAARYPDTTRIEQAMMQAIATMLKSFFGDSGIVEIL